MSVLLSLLSQVLHIGLMIAAAPTAAGVADWCSDRIGQRVGFRLGGRSGPPRTSWRTPWRELVRLTRKTPAIAEDTSAVTRVAPAFGFGATLAAAALVPSFALGMALSPLADVLAIVSLLTMARLAASFAALDSGAPLPGLAAQNASALAVPAEPALMLSVVTLGLMGGSYNLDTIIGQQREGLLLPAAASAIAAVAMLALLAAQASATDDGLHHTLGGIDLAVARMTGWLRRLVWIDLIGGLFLPVGMAGADSSLSPWLIGLAAWAVRLAGFTVALAAGRSLLGRVPNHRLPDLIGIAALLALLAVVMVLASTGTA